MHTIMLYAYIGMACQNNAPQKQTIRRGDPRERPVQLVQAILLCVRGKARERHMEAAMEER